MRTVTGGSSSAANKRTGRQIFIVCCTNIKIGTDFFFHSSFSCAHSTSTNSCLHHSFISHEFGMISFINQHECWGGIASGVLVMIFTSGKLSL